MVIYGLYGDHSVGSYLGPSTTLRDRRRNGFPNVIRVLGGPNKKPTSCRMQREPVCQF